MLQVARRRRCPICLSAIQVSQFRTDNINGGGGGGDGINSSSARDLLQVYDTTSLRR